MKTIKTFTSIALLFISHVAFSDTTVDKQIDGAKLFEIHCNACHGMTGGMNMQQRIAPPIAGVRMHYMAVHKDQESFVNAVTSWLEKQDESKSLMPGAIRHFKLMPPISVPADDAKKIAEYIYAGNIATPEGYQKHFEQMHGKQSQQQSGTTKGADNQFMRLLSRQFRMTGDQIEALQLSDDQLQKLRTLIVEKEAIMQPLREEVLEFNQRLNTLDTREPNYKSEIFSLADINARRVEQMVVESGEMRMKIESVLDAEQYQTLIDTRLQMMDRYNEMKKQRQSQE